MRTHEMTSGQKEQLLLLLREVCKDANLQLDETSLATLTIPLVGGGLLDLPILLLENATETIELKEPLVPTRKQVFPGGAIT